MFLGFFSAGTRCVVQMPRWLSWASHLTQILLLTWKIAHCAAHKRLEREMSCMPTPAVLGYLLTLALLFILLYFIFHILPCPPLFIWTTSQPLRAKHHTGWPASAPCPLTFHSQHGKEVCYGDPVKAVSAGAKPCGAELNGWAVRKPALWWETQTSCSLRWGRYWFPSNPKEDPMSELPWKNGCETMRGRSLEKRWGAVWGICISLLLF